MDQDCHCLTGEADLSLTMRESDWLMPPLVCLEWLSQVEDAGSPSIVDSACHFHSLMSRHRCFSCEVQVVVAAQYLDPEAQEQAAIVRIGMKSVAAGMDPEENPAEAVRCAKPRAGHMTQEPILGEEALAPQMAASGRARVQNIDGRRAEKVWVSWSL